MSNFSYCPLGRFISSTKSLNKAKNLQKILRFLSNDYISDSEQFLVKWGKATKNVRNYYTLWAYIFKTLNKLNPSFMDNIFQSRLKDRPSTDKYNSCNFLFGFKPFIYSFKIWSDILWKTRCVWPLFIIMYEMIQATFKQGYTLNCKAFISM